MYKNWNEICKIENEWLRMFVATSEDVELLGKMAKGFPDLFSDQQTQLNVPLTALKAKAWEKLEGKDTCVLMDGVLESFNIPYVDLGSDGVDAMPDKVPAEWLDVAKEIYDPLLGYDILVADKQPDPSPRFVDMLGEQYWIVEMSELEEDGTIEYIRLVPVKFVDFNR